MEISGQKENECLLIFIFLKISKKYTCNRTNSEVDVFDEQINEALIRETRGHKIKGLWYLISFFRKFI